MNAQLSPQQSFSHISSGWTETMTMLPPENHVVEALDAGGQIHRLQVHRRLWFLPDGQMYVYFTPTHWRPIPKQN